MTKYGRNTYEYDGNNYRVFKQTPSEKTYYSYDGSGNLRFERRGRTEINYIYDAGGIRGMKVTVPTDDPSTYYASSEFYYVKDSLGNIRVILDKSGNIMVEYNYDAWGNFEATSVGNAKIGGIAVDLVSLNAFTYRGYYYDKESGLYYLVNRYYDPRTGRFISPDDVGYLDFESFFGTNRYAYCLDDPVTYIDPTGHFFISTAVLIGAIIGGIIGLCIGFGIATYIDYKDDGQIFNGSVAWYDYLGAAILGGVIGAAIGAAIGYGIGYAAGGTYANGLVVKSVNSGLKSFLSQANRIQHVLGKSQHNLTGYSIKAMGKLMKQTLAKGTYIAYKTVDSMFWAAAGSQVTYRIIDGIIYISDMWIIK